MQEVEGRDCKLKGGWEVSGIRCKDLRPQFAGTPTSKPLHSASVSLIMDAPVLHIFESHYTSQSGRGEFRMFRLDLVENEPLTPSGPSTPGIGRNLSLLCCIAWCRQNTVQKVLKCSQRVFGVSQIYDQKPFLRLGSSFNLSCSDKESQRTFKYTNDHWRHAYASESKQSFDESQAPAKIKLHILALKMDFV